MIKHLKGLEINTIYDFDNAFSINELLCKFWEKIEETINISNESIDILNWIKEEGLPNEVQTLINQLVANGTFEQMINIDKIEELRTLINNKITNANEHMVKIESLSNNSNVDLMKTKRIAHRGFSALAPENSIPAYELASEYGFWGVECDIAETFDNEFVLMHDDTIDRTTNGSGNVSSYTLDQLKNFTIDTGSNISSYPNLKIPTLNEFLLTCKKFDIVPIIEIKNIADNSIDKFLDIIRSYGYINKAIIISFNYDLLVKIRNRDNRVMIQPLLDLNEVNINKCTDLGVNTHIDCPESQVTKELVELAHKKGLLVNVWTINDNTKLNEIIEYGVDFITTDNLYDEENLKYKIKKLGNNSIANQITTILIGSSANSQGLTYDKIINKALEANRCSTVNRFYKALNDTVVIDCPPEYKITLMPFDSNGLYLRDLGWFANGETDISKHTDVDHYHIYFGKADSSNFTYEDICNLKEKVSVCFKTRKPIKTNRKYVFLINEAPMVLQSGYSEDTCTVTYDGDESKVFTLTHDKPLTSSKIGVVFGNISLASDRDLEIRVKGESKNGFKFGFIKKSTNTILTEAEVNSIGWLYFNFIHME